MQAQNIKLEESWKKALLSEFEKPYMQNLSKFLHLQKQQHKTIYPKGDEYFRALELTPLDKVKVVILGQDPYHGENQAHGLCFSVKDGVALPPSLKNIYKEIESDLAIKPSQTGFLEGWAKQGVLLLNAVLTVEAGLAASHQGKGWEEFTDTIIHRLNAQDKPIVFMLWGAYAQKKGAFIDKNKHLVLTAPHPSPLSAHRGFLGCKHFSKANAFLAQHGQQEIDWSVK